MNNLSERKETYLPPARPVEAKATEGSLSPVATLSKQQVQTSKISQDREQVFKDSDQVVEAKENSIKSETGNIESKERFLQQKVSKLSDGDRASIKLGGGLTVNGGHLSSSVEVEVSRKGDTYTVSAGLEMKAGGKMSGGIVEGQAGLQAKPKFEATYTSADEAARAADQISDAMLQGAAISTIGGIFGPVHGSKHVLEHVAKTQPQTMAVQIPVGAYAEGSAGLKGFSTKNLDVTLAEAQAQGSTNTALRLELKKGQKPQVTIIQSSSFEASASASVGVKNKSNKSNLGLDLGSVKHKRSIEFAQSYELEGELSPDKFIASPIESIQSAKLSAVSESVEMKIQSENNTTASGDIEVESIKLKTGPGKIEADKVVSKAMQGKEAYLEHTSKLGKTSSERTRIISKGTNFNAEAQAGGYGFKVTVRALHHDHSSDPVRYYENRQCVGH